MPTVEREAKKLAFENGSNEDLKKYGTGAFEVHDQRDENYPVSDVLEGQEIDYFKKRKYWFSNGWWGNQGGDPYCVGYAWTHWLDAGPDRKSLNDDYQRKFFDGEPIDPLKIYKGAQGVDNRPGKGYPGTSVRAGAKYIQDLGFIDEYRWTSDIDEVVSALLSLGPLVTRVRWYESMYSYDEDGVVEVDRRTSINFGHAFLLTGVDVRKGLLKFKNSWGRSWGKNGYAFVSLNDFEKLLNENRWSSCCLPI